MPTLPGGDPTILGWTITLAYAATAWRCLRLRARERAGDRRVARFYTVLTVLLALLCLNTQLDLQTPLTAAVRDAAKAQGWYAGRRPVQVAAVAAGLAVVVVLGALAARALRGHLGRLWPAIAGIAVIGAYAALRTTSLHEVDAFMVGGPFPAKWWAEPLGLGLIALAPAGPAQVSRGGAPRSDPSGSPRSPGRSRTRDPRPPRP